MSLITYAETRPWAKAIKQAVLSRKMPPWFADPQHGHFANDPSLDPGEIRTVAAWVDCGALEGNPDDAPSPIQWPAGGWQIQPDLVIALPVDRVPARGPLDWVYLAAPSGLSKDTWVTSIEILPSDPSVLHHAALFFRPPRGAAADPLRGASSIQAVYVPGFRAMDYRSYSAANVVPAHSDFVLQLHYTPQGREVTERIQIGLTLARGKPTRRFLAYSPQPPGIFDRKVFRIPAGDPDWQSPPVEQEFRRNGELVWFLPHMHWRGKDMTYSLNYPDGRSEIILRVPKYDFNWQMAYEPSAPIPFLAGTIFRAIAHYDNSVNNPFNPDSSRDVYGGPQTVQEMMVPFFGLVVDTHVKPKKVISAKISGSH